MLINGWNFFILNPFDTNIEQTSQNTYMYMYNKAYDELISQLCIPDPCDILEDNKFIYCLDLSGENDKIIIDEDYDYTFLKSVFLKKKIKMIKYKLLNYYKNWNIYISSAYIENDIFYLFLEKR